MRILVSAIGLAILVLSSAAHGVWTDRWKSSDELDLAAAKLNDVPLTIGEWEGQRREMPQRHFEVAQIAGYLMADYVYRPTQKGVSVLMVCGRPGPVSVHTPDVCYGGAGYDMLGSPVKFPLPAVSPPGECWTAVFRKRQSLVPSHLRIFWSWRAADTWQAPDYPRWSFMRHRILYKLYIVRGMADEEPLADDPCLEFMQLLLPELQRVLISTR